jgi:epoxyqueuosine reductase
VELQRLDHPSEAIVSLYARGRDYHKVLRNRLQELSERIAALIGPFGHRVFTDSAPVLEAELAARSGQGWRGKHTLLLNREQVRCFFWVRCMLMWRCPPASRCRVTVALAAPAFMQQYLLPYNAAWHAVGARRHSTRRRFWKT